MRSLVNSNAFASRSEISAAGVSDIFSSRNGVSLRTGTARSDDAVLIVGDGLAVWTKGKTSGRDCFEITSAGRSHLAARRMPDGRPMLNPTLFEAGERLRRDLAFAQMVPRVTASWDPSLAGGERHGARRTYSAIVLEAASAPTRHCERWVRISPAS